MICSRRQRAALAVATLAVAGAPAFAQQTVNFATSSAGVTKSVAEWGVDTAWPNYDNVRLSVAHMKQASVDTVRLTFVTEQPLVDNGNGTYSLNATAKASIDAQLSLAALAGSNKPLTFVPTVGATDASYLASSGVNVTNWVRLIKTTQEYVNSKSGFTTTRIAAIEPFNEPDYWSGQGSAAQLNSVITQLKTYPVFATTAMVAPSTLNSNNARTWYDGVPAATQGSSHLLGGSLTSYVNFMQYVRANGKTFTNPELHSLGEAIVGAEYGMTSGTWWADVLRARGQFVQASDGKRLGYAENLSRQSAAAVYRGTDGKIRAFAGGLERFGQATAYRFVSTDREVYFNGIPTREFMLQTKPDANASSTDNDFANYGSWSNQGAYADVESAPTLPPLDGYRWKIVNVSSNQPLEVVGTATSDGALIRTAADSAGLNQKWNIVRTRNGYFHLFNADSGRTAEVANGSLANQASVRQWGTADNNIQQWYIEDAGGGTFYIRNANSTKYLTGNPTNAFQNDLTVSTLQKWRFVLDNPTRAAKARYALQSNVNDTSGTYNATAFNGPTYAAGPTAGTQAIRLDGVNDYVQLPAAVANSADITISATVKWDGGAAWQRLFDFGNDTTSYMFLTPSSGAGTMRFAITKSGNTGEEMLETSALPTNQWVTLTLTIGGQTGVLYVNGRPQVAGQLLLDPAAIVPTKNYLGRSQFASDPYFAGQISDFHIYDYALAPSQVENMVVRRWTGAANANWTASTVASPKNWTYDGAATDYLNGHVVLFDDSATSYTVNIADASLAPAAVLFDHSSHNYTLSGSGSITGTARLTKRGTGALTIANANTYSGGTVVGAGRLNINHASAIGTGALTIYADATIDNTSGAAITLATNNAQTWAGDFTFGGTNALNLGTSAATLSSDRVVTVNGTATLSIASITQAGGDWSFTKAGPGTLAVRDGIGYVGPTTLLAGSLVVGNGARLDALAKAGVDIRGGQLVFDYTGTSSPAAAVLSILDAGYSLATTFSAGPIRSTTLPAGQLLGWLDRASASQLVVRPTLPGDANLDLVVNFDDLLLLAASYGQTNRVWSNGDFNYDGSVNFDDLLALAGRYGQSAPATKLNAKALSVPEPAATLPLLLGIAALRRRGFARRGAPR
jgi:autotransporter-associated beta strand protein